MAGLDGASSGDGGRARRTTVRLMCAVGAVLLGAAITVTEVLAALDESPDRPMARSTQGLELSDDDAAASMFTIGNARPGHRTTRCIAVSHRGLTEPRVVKIHGSGTGSGLEPALDLTIEAGSGGTFEDCAGFRGTVLYRGTLAAFLSAYPHFESGLAMSPSQPTGTTTFRFSLLLRDDHAAQGRTTRATFTWETRDDGLVAVPPTPGTDESPEAPRAAPVREVPVARPSPVTAEEPSAASTGDGGVPTAPSGHPAERRARAGTGSQRPSESAPSVLERVGQWALEVSKKAAFPVLLLLLMLLFLLLQDQIDRRDPKLALAPVYPEPDLPFPPAGVVT